ncbi:S9 family peptidase [Paenibacillus wulumuqiensis]|uniref:S9 family peptidase n=1 Tax=Paenibacillus wulumuqiensis TaxID=1567107 RepID=UPI0006198BAE|nr:S9 family peptidase [Paenibacillus wulumuqiensis]
MKDRRNVQAEDLYRLKWTEQPEASPSGGAIVYVSRQVNDSREGYHSHLRIIHQDGSGDRQFTAGERDHSPAWSPSGQQLAFLRKKEEHTQVWIIPADGGEAYPATDLKHGVQSFKWSPDGSWLLLLAEQEQEEQPEKAAALQQGSDTDQTSGPAAASKKAVIIDRITYKSDGGGLWQGRRTHLYVHSLVDSTGRWLTTGEYDVHSYGWAPDSTRIAFTAHIPSDEEPDPDFVRSSDLYTLHIQGDHLHRWTNNEYDMISLSWSPDGQQIAFIASDQSYHNATLTRLYQLSLPEGSITCLCQNSDRLIGNYLVGDSGVGSTVEPVYSRDGQQIYTLLSEQGTVQLIATAADGSGYQVMLDGPRNVHYFTLTMDEHIIFVAADSLQPGELFCRDTVQLEERQLTHWNDELLSQLRLSVPQELQLTSVDGRPLQAWLMPPVREYDADNRVPAILEIHGGPHMMYGYTFMHEFQLLTSQGYAVIFSNPRGSHGYGQQFVNACRGDYGGGDYRDLMEVTDYVLEHYDWIDPDRLGVTGGSYGGFMTNWIVGHTDRFKAAVTQRSICNWVSFYGVSDIGFYFTEDQIGGTPWQRLETLWKHSPLAFVENVKTPILVLHGEQDLRCPMEQAEQWFTGLKRIGAVTRLVRFPDADHNLSRSGHPQLRIQRLEHIAGWFEQYL